MKATAAIESTPAAHYIPSLAAGLTERIHLTYEVYLTEKSVAKGNGQIGTGRSGAALASRKAKSSLGVELLVTPLASLYSKHIQTPRRELPS